MRRFSRQVPNVLPNLPNLQAKVGNPESLAQQGLPNRPNLPNLFSRPRAPARIRTHAHVRTCTCVCTCVISGEEGWEG